MDDTEIVKRVTDIATQYLEGCIVAEEAVNATIVVLTKAGKFRTAGAL